MSIAAVMLVKDEDDLIEPVLHHLAASVDEIIVADNRSTDGTRAILDRLTAAGLPLLVRDDPEVGYYQARKTTELARLALERGHAWVIPCDADEVWHANDLRPLRDWLAGLARDVMYVSAPMYHHLPTSEDPPASCDPCRSTGLRVPDGSEDGGPCPVCRGRVEPNILRRIGWRQREHGTMGKVACRLRHGLEIRQGNHSAYAPGAGLTSGGVSIRHFPWRSPEQYLRKVRNGEVAYAATNLPATAGEHWRQYAGKPDEAVTGWFWDWGYSLHPRADDTLIYDPAPIMSQP